jgi:hypothetical protein
MGVKKIMAEAFTDLLVPKPPKVSLVTYRFVLLFAAIKIWNEFKESGKKMMGTCIYSCSYKHICRT